MGTEQILSDLIGEMLSASPSIEKMKALWAKAGLVWEEDPVKRVSMVLKKLEALEEGQKDSKKDPKKDSKKDSQDSSFL